MKNKQKPRSSWLVGVIAVALATTFTMCDSAEVTEANETVTFEAPVPDAEDGIAHERKQGATNQVLAKNSQLNCTYTGTETYSLSPCAINPDWDNLDVPGHSGQGYEESGFMSGSTDTERLLNVVDSLFNGTTNEVKNIITTISDGAEKWHNSIWADQTTMDIRAEATMAFGRNTELTHPGHTELHGSRGGREPGVSVLYETCADPGGQGVTDDDPNCESAASGDKSIVYDWSDLLISCLGQGDRLKMRYRAQWGELGWTSTPTTCDGNDIQGSQSVVDISEETYRVFRRTGSSYMLDSPTGNGDTFSDKGDVEMAIGGTETFEANENFFLWIASCGSGTTWTKINSTAADSVSFSNSCTRYGAMVSATGYEFKRFRLKQWNR